MTQYWRDIDPEIAAIEGEVKICKVCKCKFTMMQVANFAWVDTVFIFNCPCCNVILGTQTQWFEVSTAGNILKRSRSIK